MDKGACAFAAGDEEDIDALAIAWCLVGDSPDALAAFDLARLTREHDGIEQVVENEKEFERTISVEEFVAFEDHVAEQQFL